MSLCYNLLYMDERFLTFKNILPPLALFFVALVSLTFPLTIRATSEDISARVFISGLSTAPQTPSGFQATVLSPSSVRLSWFETSGALGYLIYRDGVLAASTTVFYYSDDNLTAGTAYGYQISAYNAVGSSLPTELINITTASLFASEPITKQGGSASARFSVYNFKVEPVSVSGVRAVQIRFNTTIPVHTTFSYGADADTDLAVVAGTGYEMTHSFLLDGLPASGYLYLSFECVTEKGDVHRFVYDDRPPFLDHPMVPDVSDLSIAQTEDSNVVTWDNPSSPEFSYAHLVRSDVFYPVSPSFGLPLYRGKKEAYVDRDINVDQQYFYGVFACDIDGECSPGSFAAVGPKTEKITSTSTLSGSTSVGSSDSGQITAFAGSRFTISFPFSENDRLVRMYVVNLYLGEKLVGTYQLKKNIDQRRWETSPLEISVPGSFRYQIERYKADRSDPEIMTDGSIITIEAPTQAPLDYVWLWPLFLLPLLVFWLWWRNHWRFPGLPFGL